MTCPHCGTANLDNASICANCGRLLAGGPAHTPPPPPPRPRASFGAHAPATGGVVPNYLVPSVLVTFCCCLPLGIVALVFAAQVNSKFAAGDVAGAREASANAKKWVWIAFLVGLAVWLVFATVYGVAVYQAIRSGTFDR